MVALFDAVGPGQWFRDLTGLLEVAGALLLSVPRLASVGALHLAGVMAGAVVAHLTVVRPQSPAVPLGLLAALAGVAYARRGNVALKLGLNAGRA